MRGIKFMLVVAGFSALAAVITGATLGLILSVMSELDQEALTELLCACLGVFGGYFIALVTFVALQNGEEL